MWLCQVASWLCRRVLFWFCWIGHVWLMGDKQWLLFYNWKKLCACQVCCLWLLDLHSLYFVSFHRLGCCCCAWIC
ncbi:hypothetical protein NC652_034780 [Populus alba x Populus x berolinensis]|nr:hypothetical protein NC652_034780 [Populus alba x Populus x berolinensis]